MQPVQPCEHVLDIPLNDGSGKGMCVGVPDKWWRGLSDANRVSVIEKFRSSFLQGSTGPRSCRLVFVIATRKC